MNEEQSDEEISFAVIVFCLPFTFQYPKARNRDQIYYREKVKERSERESETKVNHKIKRK